MGRHIKMILSYLALIIWMIVIFGFSSQNGASSGGTSDGVITSIIEVFGFIFNITFTEQEVLEVISSCGVWIRKCAHFTEYFILGLLMTNALRFTIKDRKNFAVILVLLCFIYALSDELHQIFIPGRSGNIFDALIDLSGSYAGIMIFVICEKYKEVRIYFRNILSNDNVVQGL